MKNSLLLLGFIPVIMACEQIFDDLNGSKKDLHKIFDLPGELSESSGLIIYDSLLWTFNDSENEAYLYGIDLVSGSIQRIINLQNTRNIDWEGIAQDETCIYIGDIGNMAGDRDTLDIYVLQKNDMGIAYEQNCNAGKVSFSFEDQVNFESTVYATPYDCEALISIGDSLYVFTKDWVNSHSALYSFPKTSGFHSARRIVEFNSRGLITGAGYDAAMEQIALCGYDNYVPFILLVDVSTGLNIDDQMISRYEFIGDFGVQVEGIDYSGEKIYLTCENSSRPQAFLELR